MPLDAEVRPNLSGVLILSGSKPKATDVQAYISLSLPSLEGVEGDPIRGRAKLAQGDVSQSPWAEYVAVGDRSKPGLRQARDPILKCGVHRYGGDVESGQWLRQMGSNPRGRSYLFKLPPRR